MDVEINNNFSNNWSNRGHRSPPTYKLLEKRGNVKIKVYAPMVVAKSIIEGNYDSALKKDFTGIVNYIFNKKLSNNKGVKNE